MGVNKGALYYKGKSLIDRIIVQCINTSDDVFFAGNNLNNSFGIRNFPDSLADSGPLAGIKSGLENALNDWVLFIPIDALHYSIEIHEPLVQCLSANISSKIIVPTTKDQEHYLNGLYHKSCSSAIEKCFSCNDFRVRALIERCKTSYLSLDPKQTTWVANINSTKDLDTFGLMKVKIIAFGQIEEILGNNEMDWITDSKTIKELDEELHSNYPLLQKTTYRIALNQTIIGEDASLNQNDTIALLPPFAGG